MLKDEVSTGGRSWLLLHRLALTSSWLMLLEPRRRLLLVEEETSPLTVSLASAFCLRMGRLEVNLRLVHRGLLQRTDAHAAVLLLPFAFLLALASFLRASLLLLRVRR